MGFREITIKQSVAEKIAEIAWYLESEGLPATAEKFSDEIYNFIEKISDIRKRHRICRDPQRALMGYKCISYKRKYTLVIIELDAEIMVCDVVLSKKIYW